MPLPALMLDTNRNVLTPEGVTLALSAAGPVSRALAWCIDLAVRLVALLASGMLLVTIPGFGGGVWLIVLFLIYWGYPILLEALWDGRTVGKRVLGLQVVAADGGPVGWMAVIARNLLRTVDMLPFGYASGLISCLVDAHSRRLGDLAAGTLVVHARQEPPPASAPVNAVVAPLLPLRPDEQAAIVAFGERAPRLRHERQQELADLVESLTQASGQGSVLRLYGIANWLLGRI